MKIAIVDSGLGGLSICALLVQGLFDGPVHAKQRNDQDVTSIEIKYINAAPENDWGFNQMESREQKIFFFDKVLSGIEKCYQSDFIFIACHTLSVLLDETSFFREKQSRGLGERLAGMVPLGMAQITQHLARNPSSAVIVFAAETTIEESIYSGQLEKSGISRHRIVAQALPGVATLISNDLQGKEVYQAISRFVEKALSRMPDAFTDLHAFLGCTHYGFRVKLFEKAFQVLGRRVRILNPNEAASRQILSRVALQDMGSVAVQAEEPVENHRRLKEKPGPHSRNVSLEFVSRYALPGNEVATLSCFLSPLSSRTAHALRNYTLEPDLF